MGGCEWEDAEWEDAEWEDAEWEDAEWEDAEWEDAERKMPNNRVAMPAGSRGFQATDPSQQRARRVATFDLAHTKLGKRCYATESCRLLVRGLKATATGGASLRDWRN